jgi:hypothetical protein
MKPISIVPFLAGALTLGALATAGAARAADVHVGVNIGVPAPIYVAPTPVYAPPPPPVIYQPPAPVYVRPPVVIGWYGDRYWDGRRYWSRNDWYRYHRYDHGYDHGHGHGHPPGHAYGHDKHHH